MHHEQIDATGGVDTHADDTVVAVVNAGGRGLLRGVMRDTGGNVVASVAQEMRLTPITGSV